jgi:hypothetical protein
VNENLHVGVETWSGDDAVLEVAAFVAELGECFQIVEAVFDPWRAGQMAQEWEQRGIPAVAFPQSDSRMIPASERLYDAVAHQRLTHPDDAELNEHVHAAIAKHSRRGWRLDKTRPHLEDRCGSRPRHGRRAAGLPARASAGSRMAMTMPCLDCGALTKGSRCSHCQAKREVDEWTSRRKIRSGWDWGKLASRCEHATAPASAAAGPMGWKFTTGYRSPAAAPTASTTLRSSASGATRQRTDD